MTPEQVAKVKEEIKKIAIDKNCYDVKVSEFMGEFELAFEGEITFSLLDTLSKKLGTEYINCGSRHIKAYGCRTCNHSYDEQVIYIKDIKIDNEARLCHT